MTTKWRPRNVPVPAGYVIGLAVAIGLHRACRWRLPAAHRAGHLIGWPLVISGIGIVVASVRAAGDVDLEQADRLVTRGPYAYCRNPMYTGWALASLGAGFVADSAWIVSAVPIAAWRAHRDVLREESQLARWFGEAFNAYRAQVPRYALSRRRWPPNGTPATRIVHSRVL